METAIRELTYLAFRYKSDTEEGFIFEVKQSSQPDFFEAVVESFSNMVEKYKSEIQLVENGTSKYEDLDEYIYNLKLNLDFSVAWLCKKWRKQENLDYSKTGKFLGLKNVTIEPDDQEPISICMYNILALQSLGELEENEYNGVFINE